MKLKQLMASALVATLAASGAESARAEGVSYLCFTAKEANSAVQIDGPLNDRKFEYSTDGTTWTKFVPSGQYSLSQQVNLANVGDKVYVRGDNPKGVSEKDAYRTTRFVLAGKIAASGNVMTLLNPTGMVTKIESEYCFARLFYDCTNLTSVANLKLPSTVLSKYCYSLMFYNCTSLVDAPELPATWTEPYCYSSMFEGCTSLVEAPELPEMDCVSEGCCQAMFASCKSLTKAPKLSREFVARNCYASMFFGCTSLKEAPELSEEYTAISCYASMFSGCTSLTKAPALSSTNDLADMCYEGMFYGCTSLTEAPVLPAPKLGIMSYMNMFDGCSSLASITMLATDVSAKDCLKEWVKGVAPTGTFTKNADTHLETGVSGIPEGWTVKSQGGSGEEPEPDPTPDPTPDPEAPAAIKGGEAYNGFIQKDGGLTGTFTLTVKKPKKNQTTASATLVKVDVSTGKKVKITGTVDVTTGVCSGDLEGLKLDAAGVSGKLGDEDVQAGVDAAKAKDKDKLAVMDKFNKRVYSLVLKNADGSPVMLTATFSKKGRAKVAGSVNGAKISGSAQMSVGDRCAMPFLYSKKGVVVTFVLWFDKEGNLLEVNNCGAGAECIGYGSPAAQESGDYVFTMLDVTNSVPRAISETPFNGVDVKFDGKKYDAGKAAKVKYNKKTKTLEVEAEKDVSGLKLKYAKGALSGSFTIYEIDPVKDKLVKNKFTITGVVVNGFGFAVGANKKLKSIPCDLDKKSAK